MNDHRLQEEDPESGQDGKDHAWNDVHKEADGRSKHAEYIILFFERFLVECESRAAQVEQLYKDDCPCSLRLSQTHKVYPYSSEDKDPDAYMHHI